MLFLPLCLTSQCSTVSHALRFMFLPAKAGTGRWGQETCVLFGEKLVFSFCSAEKLLASLSYFLWLHPVEAINIINVLFKRFFSSWWKAVVESHFFFFQSEAEGKSVAGTLNFNAAPDAQTLYNAMKGLGELTPTTYVNSMFLYLLSWNQFLRKFASRDITSFLLWKTNIKVSSVCT